MQISYSSRLHQSDRRIALVLFLVVSSVYFATIVGVTSSNDGSHYALTRAIVDHRSFEISPYMDFTEHLDYSLRGDLRFSDRPPGTAFMAAPLYALSAIAPQPLITPLSKHDGANPRLLYVVATAVLSASGSVTIFYLTLRRFFKTSPQAALVTALTLAFATITWKYGSVLFSHAQAGLILWLTVYLIFAAEDETDPHPSRYVIIGILLGFAPLVEYTSAVVSALFGIYLLLRLWRRPSHRLYIAPLLIGGIISFSILLIYNTLNFGSPFEISTFNVDFELWPQNEGFAADFATPIPVGLRALLFTDGDNQGIFLLSPVILLSFFGFWPLIRRHPRRATLLLAIFVAMLLLFSASTTYNAATNDGRYLTPYLGLLLVLLAVWLDEHFFNANSEWYRLLYAVVFFGLLFISIRNQMVHIVFSWNYDFDLTKLRPMAIPLENLSYFFRTLFPNAGNLPLLWQGEGVFVLGMLIWCRWRRLRAVEPEYSPN